jgi:hypothetical protein
MFLAFGPVAKTPFINEKRFKENSAVGGVGVGKGRGLIGAAPPNESSDELLSANARL